MGIGTAESGDEIGISSQHEDCPRNIGDDDDLDKYTCSFADIRTSADRLENRVDRAQGDTREGIRYANSPKGRDGIGLTCRHVERMDLGRHAANAGQHVVAFVDPFYLLHVRHCAVTFIHCGSALSQTTAIPPQENVTYWE